VIVASAVIWLAWLRRGHRRTAAAG